MDLGIYIIHGACMATGSSPISVTAHEDPKLRPDFFNEVEETIRFTHGFSERREMRSDHQFQS